LKEQHVVLCRLVGVIVRLWPAGAHDRLAAGERAPQLFRDERHHRMQQDEHTLEHMREDRALIHFVFLAALVQTALRPLDVPVGELGPRELPQLLGCPREVVLLHRPVHFTGHRFESREDPAIRQCQSLAGWQLAGCRPIQKHEPRDVPKLVAEVPVSLDPFLVDGNVAPERCSPDQGHAKGIGPVLVDHHERIDHVPERLRHLLPSEVTHHPMDVSIPERHVFHEMDAHHHHARHPERDDVVAGHEHTRRVVRLEILGRVGPSEGRERPQRR